jgi:hypothetical protein
VQGQSSPTGGCLPFPFGANWRCFNSSRRRPGAATGCIALDLSIDLAKPMSHSKQHRLDGEARAHCTNLTVRENGRSRALAEEDRAMTEDASK